MPIISYACEEKHVTKKFVRRAADAAPSISCEKCQKNSRKILSAPNSLSKISIDNGSQSRAVEIMPDIVDMIEERSNKNYRED